MKELRPAIIRMHQRGIPKREISRLLDILLTVVFVEQGVKFDRYAYMEMLEDHLIPWAREHFDDSDWCFQQDSAPGHKANETQEWLSEECPDFISRDKWPSNSPDLNPMDYSVWSILEEKACAKSHYNVESLKRALTKA